MLLSFKWRKIFRVSLNSAGYQSQPKPSQDHLKHELQALAGSIAALRHIIPQSSKKCLSMYEEIKEAPKHNVFNWTRECKKILQKIKDFFTSPPVMIKPSPCEPLKLYLLAADFTTAVVLVKEAKSDQRPVYYTSHILKEAETRYSDIEKPCTP